MSWSFCFCQLITEGLNSFQLHRNLQVNEAVVPLCFVFGCESAVSDHFLSKQKRVAPEYFLHRTRQDSHCQDEASCSPEGENDTKVNMVEIRLVCEHSHIVVLTLYTKAHSGVCTMLADDVICFGAVFTYHLFLNTIYFSTGLATTDLDTAVVTTPRVFPLAPSPNETRQGSTTWPAPPASASSRRRCAAGSCPWPSWA
jgi:hypothetical protein